MNVCECNCVHAQNHPIVSNVQLKLTKTSVCRLSLFLRRLVPPLTVVLTFTLTHVRMELIQLHFVCDVSFLPIAFRCACARAFFNTAGEALGNARVWAVSMGSSKIHYNRVSVKKPVYLLTRCHKNTIKYSVPKSSSLPGSHRIISAEVTAKKYLFFIRLIAIFGIKPLQQHTNITIGVSNAIWSYSKRHRFAWDILSNDRCVILRRILCSIR